jgi:hypothetical protein
LSAFVERVYALPQLKEHLAGRNDTYWCREYPDKQKAWFINGWTIW